MLLSKTLLSLFVLFLVCQGQDLSGKTLIVGNDPTFPPLESLQNGTVVGFSMDFLEALSTVAGFQYDISQMAFPNIFSSLLNGTIDVGLSSITITSVRNLTYDFSVPYFIATSAILALNTTNITGGQDLVNHKVASVVGTTDLASVIYLTGGNSSNPNIIVCSTNAECLEAVANGTVDAFVFDSTGLVDYANNNPGFVVIEDTNNFPQQFYGLMFQKGSDLVAPIDAAITQVIQSGTYQTIYKKWLGIAADTNLLLQAGQFSNPYAVFVHTLV